MGKTIPKAKLEFMRADGDGKPIKYYEVELENVLIANIDQVAHEGGILHDSIGLRFSRMRHFLIATLLVVSAANAEEKGKWTGRNKPLKDATYLIYSGEPGDRGPPTNADRKLAIAIRGLAAKEIFDSIGPDAKGVSCSLEDGERMRSKGEVWCSYMPSDGYMCFLGFNLKTGEPHSGGTC